MRAGRRMSAVGAGAVGAGLLFAAAAWACVSGPVVNLSTVSAKAGQEVGLTGSGFPTANPVQVRFNALDGPLLATVDAPITGGLVNTKFTVPEGTKPGSYVIVVTQTNPAGQLSLSPVRAVIGVTGEAGAQPVVGATGATTDPSARSAGLTRTDESIGAGSLALVALGVGGVGMFLAGMAALFAGRRPATPEAVRARR